MGFGKSRAKLLTEAHGRVTFEDVAGVDEAKQDLQEIVEFLRDPSKFQRLGGRIPRGVLLVGPPGTGKTLIARAVAGEANVPFFTISGSDFVEMFVGVGASRVRDMFEQAKKNAPCIIFIDEIDAVGRHRGAGLGGGNDEREQTLNQLLVEMDGFEANEGIILIAATNRPDVLDPALLRPGRFDRQVIVPNPDVVGREQILKVHVRKVPLAPDVNLKTIARGTPGFSGADLMNLVNEAALMAARRNRRMVTQDEFEDAKDKVMMGAERKSLVMTEEEKMLTAYHEGGHAIVALNVKATDPVHKATIIPRGRALGMVMQLPERDKLSMSFEQMTSRLAIMMGGRIAEEMIFGHDKVTSGAQSDIEQATRLARMMVTRWGFSPELGTVAYGENQEEVFLGHSVSRTQNISEEHRPEDRRRGAASGRGRAERSAPDPDRASAPTSRRSPRACSNSRRCPATRSRTCSTAGRRCAKACPSRRRRALPRCRRPASSGRGPSPSRRPATWSRSRRLRTSSIFFSTTFCGPLCGRAVFLALRLLALALPALACPDLRFGDVAACGAFRRRSVQHLAGIVIAVMDHRRMRDLRQCSSAAERSSTSAACTFARNPLQPFGWSRSTRGQCFPVQKLCCTTLSGNRDVVLQRQHRDQQGRAVIGLRPRSCPDACRFRCRCFWNCPARHASRPRWPAGSDR